MKINIRYLGKVIEEVNLNSNKNEYLLGRSEECDIRLAKDFISRKHARIFFEDGLWFYQDLRVDHPNYSDEKIPLEDSKVLEIEKEMELVTSNYLNHGQTRIIKLKRGTKKSRRPLWLAASILIMLLAGGGIHYKNNFLPLSSVEILAHSQTRFIEFELKKDQNLERELVAKGILKEEDFKDEVGFCSGFLIGPKMVMTASHCLLGADGVSPMDQFDLKTHDGKKHQISRVLGLDLSRDIIVVEVDTLEGYPYFEFKNDHEVGEAVYTVGNVHGEGMAIRNGTISSVTKDPNNPDIEYLRYTAATSPGNSGGPLVDQFGKVVGLVFARSNAAENYNLSAPYFTLTNFKKNSLAIQEPRDVELNTEKLIFGSFLLVKYTQYNLISEALQNNKYFFKQENQEKLNKIKFNVSLPQSYKDFKEDIEKKAVSKMKENIEHVLAELKEAEQVGDKWTTQVTPKHPVLIPRDLDDSLLTLDQLTEDYVWEKNILILQPGYYAEADASDHSYYAGSLDNIFPKDFDLSRRSVFPQYLRSSIYPFNTFLSAPTSLVLLDYSADEPQALDELKFKNSFQTEGYFSLSAQDLAYAFIRPKKLKEYKIENLKFEDQGSIEDQNGRKWRKSKAHILGHNFIDRYCLDYPQAQMCINNPSQDLNKLTYELQEKSFVSNFLSEKILDLNFWTTDALHSYLQNKPSFEFSDMKLEKKTQGYQLGYEYLGLSFPISKSVKMIKAMPAVIRTEDGKGQWAIVGHQTYLPKSRKSPAMICRSELDFPGLKTSFLAKTYHQNKLAKRTIANNEGNKISVKTIKSDRWSNELKLYQACREVFKVEYNEGYHMGEFVDPPTDAF